MATQPNIAPITNGFLDFNDNENQYINPQHLARFSDVANEKIIWINGEKKTFSNKDIIVFHSREESQEYLNSKLKLKEITDPSELTNAYGIYKHCMFEPTMEKFCRKMTEYLQDESVKIYACLSLGEMKGITVISIAESNAEILGIAVDENIRNCGIGTYMVNEIVKLHNIPFIYAETDDDAVGFYQKNKFSITQFTDNYNEVRVRRYKCELHTKKGEKL